MKNELISWRLKMYKALLETELSVPWLKVTRKVMKNYSEEEQEKIAKEILEKIRGLKTKEEILVVIKNIR